MAFVRNRWDKPIPELDATDPSQLLGLGLTPGNACSFFPHHTAAHAALVAAQQPALGHSCVWLAEQAAGAPPPSAATEGSESAAISVMPLAAVGAVEYWASLTGDAKDAAPLPRDPLEVI
jgi:hypothetical protein